MKKIIVTLIIAVAFMACSTYKSLDLGKLTTGMTKAEVQAVVGAPDRVLSVNDKAEGYQEILEYRTSRDEVYALEFWNDYLTGYEFLYDDITYTPALLPPPVMPPYGRPIYIINDRPNRPNRPNRPQPPTSPERPTTRPPANERPSTRPTPTERPSTRPSTSGSTRPTTPSVQPSTRPSTSNSSSAVTTDRSGLAR